MALVVSVLRVVRMRLETGVRLVVKMVRPLRWLMGGARMGRVGVGIRRMFPTLVRKLRHGPLCEGPQGPRRRLVGQIASGSAVCDATNLVWTWGVWTGPGVWSAGSLGRALGGQKVPSDSVRDPSTCFACLVLSRSCSCPVLSWPVPPGAEGQSLTAAVLRGAAGLQVLETECFEACLDDPDNPGSRFWVVWRSVAWESGTGSQLSQLQGEASAIDLFLGLVVGILCV